MAQQYHCFWVEPVGLKHRYKAFDAFDDEMKKLVSDNAVDKSDDNAYSNVINLKVIYGELLAFEPAQVVTDWKIVR